MMNRSLLEQKYRQFAREKSEFDLLYFQTDDKDAKARYDKISKSIEVVLTCLLEEFDKEKGE